jgi:CubicO group peptidase (beta-lactamase class C family)
MTLQLRPCVIGQIACRFEATKAALGALRSGEGMMAASDPDGERAEAGAASALLSTRRQVLGIGAGAALTPLLAATASRAEPALRPAVPDADPAGLEAAVDDLVRKTGVKPTDPGLAVLLTRPGRILLMKGYGLADLRTGAPITRWTRFEIASVSKTFTATALLMLQQRGVISIDDDIRKFIPELPQYTGGPVRLRHMLQHVSGLPSYFDLKNVPMSRKTYWVSEDYPAAFARQLPQFPLRFSPGRKYEYNNTNFLLMAVAIERIAGKPFARFMQDEIFAPAGMVDTFIYDSPESVPAHSDHPCNNALGYEFKNKAWVENWGTAPERHEKHLEVGDGAIWSNLADMANWDAAIRSNRFLTPETMRTALTPSKTRDGKTNLYGLGWALFADRTGRIQGFGHAGYWGGFRTDYHHDLADGHTVVVLSNRGLGLDLDAMWFKFDAMIRTRARA